MSSVIPKECHKGHWELHAKKMAQDYSLRKLQYKNLSALQIFTKTNGNKHDILKVTI
jgi:hypothetical protein